ncbi:MAG: hypothetical protein OXI80_15760 [Caldilineaceae bacterium]|nr:hypothetical protein [Caldilineaceae bacterium]
MSDLLVSREQLSRLFAAILANEVVVLSIIDSVPDGSKHFVQKSLRRANEVRDRMASFYLETLRTENSLTLNSDIFREKYSEVIQHYSDHPSLLPNSGVGATNESLDGPLQDFLSSLFPDDDECKDS